MSIHLIYLYILFTSVIQSDPFFFFFFASKAKFTYSIDYTHRTSVLFTGLVLCDLSTLRTYFTEIKILYDVNIAYDTDATEGRSLYDNSCL